MEAFNGSNRWKKRGLAAMPVKFGMSFTAKFMNQAHPPPAPPALSSLSPSSVQV